MNQNTRIAAYGLILHSKKLLLCRLSPSVPHSVGQWTLPGGGLDFGESSHDAMLREVFEETGLKVDVGPLLAVDSICSQFKHEQLHSIRILYSAAYLGGELSFEQDGTTDKCDWFTKEEAHKLPLVDLAKLGVKLVFE